MSGINVSIKLGSLLLAALLLVSFPAITQAAPGTTGKVMPQTATLTSWQPARPPAKMASIVWTNYNGNGGQLSIDLQRGNLEAVRDNGQDTHQFIVDSQSSYVIPAAMNSDPGRMQANIAPGTYEYTASVPDIGTVNGTLTVKAGQVIGLSFFGGDPKTIVHNHSQSHGHNTDHSYSVIVFTKLLSAEQDLTAQARSLPGNA